MNFVWITHMELYFDNYSPLNKTAILGVFQKELLADKRRNDFIKQLTPDNELFRGQVDNIIIEPCDIKGLVFLYKNEETVGFLDINVEEYKVEI